MQSIIKLWKSVEIRQRTNTRKITNGASVINLPIILIIQNNNSNVTYDCNRILSVSLPTATSEIM